MVRQRSRWFIKRGMRWTSQATSFARTGVESHGGAAWTAIRNVEDQTGKALALFHNSIFGGILRNHYGATQKTGRAELQVRSIPCLPSPAFHADTENARRAREIAERNFDELANLILEPFAYCFRDENRKLIDNVVAEMMGLDSNDEGIQELLEHYRLLFASEPNVNGRQKKIVTALTEYKAGKSS